MEVGMGSACHALNLAIEFPMQQLTECSRGETNAELLLLLLLQSVQID